jgi:hypothetical protein
MKLTIIAAILLASTSWAQAQTVSVPAGQQGADAQQMQRPARGITMADVSRRFGEPAQKLAPIGNPPITRWVYPQYTVYFEFEHVIHAVLHP